MRQTEYLRIMIVKLDYVTLSKNNYMNVNKLLEEKLWSVSREKLLDQETSDRIIDYLLARLSDYLQQPLTLVGDNWLNETAFSADFVGAIAPRDVFRISYVGTLGMTTFGDKDEPHVGAWLFLFGDKHRITAGQLNRSFIYLEYERKNDNIGVWKSRGWQIDEFDEFEDIVEEEYHHNEMQTV